MCLFLCLLSPPSQLGFSVFIPSLLKGKSRRTSSHLSRLIKAYNRWLTTGNNPTHRWPGAQPARSPCAGFHIELGVEIIRVAHLLTHNRYLLMFRYYDSYFTQQIVTVVAVALIQKFPVACQSPGSRRVWRVQQAKHCGLLLKCEELKRTQ